MAPIDQNPSSNNIQTLRFCALFAAVMLVGANSFVLSPILSDVAADLETQAFRIAWAISAFGGATAISALLLGQAIDRVPAGRVLGGAAAVLALAQIASACSNGWLTLCMSQFLAGIAVGVMLPGTYATSVAIAEPGREAAKLGLVLTGWALSLVLAVPLAAFLAERIGWRMVYVLLATVSALTAAALYASLRGVQTTAATRSSPMQALRVPGVAPLLAVMFVFMTSFYGAFAYLGEGIRAAFAYSPKGTGMFVLSYGLGFGLGGVALSLISPRITRGYITAFLICAAVSYASWRFALASPVVAFVAALVWGVLNQILLNALVVSLSRQAGPARGAVLGLNSAVTYSAVFAGPVLMGYVFLVGGFPAVTTLAAAFALLGAIICWINPLKNG